MKVVLIRHGKTPGNENKQYIGSTDETLAESGKLQLRTFQSQGFYPPVEGIYSSPMIRCKESVEIIYPENLWQVNADLAEYNFGEFEQKTHEELQQDHRFQEWMDGTGAPPGGEAKVEFKIRVLRGFRTILQEAMKKNQTTIAVVLHGGSIMAIMEEYTQETGSFYQYMVENGNGYQMIFDSATSEWQDLKLIETKRLWGA